MGDACLFTKWLLLAAVSSLFAALVLLVLAGRVPVQLPVYKLACIPFQFGVEIIPHFGSSATKQVRPELIL